MRNIYRGFTSASTPPLAAMWTESPIQFIHQLASMAAEHWMLLAGIALAVYLIRWAHWVRRPVRASWASLTPPRGAGLDVSLRWATQLPVRGCPVLGSLAWARGGCARATPDSRAISSPCSRRLGAQVLKNYEERLDFLTEETIKIPSRVWGAWFLGQGTVILAGTPAAVQHVLKDNFYNYEKGPYFRKRFQELLGDGIFNSDGHQWLVQR